MRASRKIDNALITIIDRPFEGRRNTGGLCSFPWGAVTTRRARFRNDGGFVTTAEPKELRVAMQQPSTYRCQLRETCGSGRQIQCEQD